KFYPEEDLLAKKPERELREATANGRFEDEGWRIRKDGSRFWANVILTALRDESGRLIGFGKITKDMTERKRYEEELKKQGAALGAANKELEAFSYSVSHDLRSPLRGIDGFSQALLEDYDTKLDEEGRKYLQYIRAGTQKMGRLIDDLLNLSRMTRSEMTVAEVSLTELARNIEASLRAASPDREVLVDIQEGLRAEGDRGLLNVMLENLISNAWKFTAKKENASIEFGSELRGEECVFFIRDNGAGFDMKYYDKLFGAFQRLHSEAEYRGTGVGLATVRRIVTRHAGQIWAESTVGEGTTFFFTL
ncbi:MAG: PAS domain-containing sensor histidine kinase, partial [Proteobacteria bacterium]